MNKMVHVFFGNFTSVEAACRYTEPQWADEPDDDASDEVYDAWEESNPTWSLADDLGVYLDSDFIETIDEDFCSYLRTQLAKEADFLAVCFWQPKKDPP